MPPHPQEQNGTQIKYALSAPHASKPKRIETTIPKNNKENKTI